MAPRSTTAPALAVVTLFGLWWASQLGLLALAVPTHVDWMFEGDWFSHYFGWVFVRNGPLGLPLAQAPDLVAPTGSSAAMTDAIPLVAALARLASPWLPEHFQYFGAWMVLAVVGTGWAGVLVLRAWTRDAVALALGGCLFVLNPVVSTRYGHPSLMASWVLLGLVGAALWPAEDARQARRLAVVSLGLEFVACGTHAYLAVMAAALALAVVVRLGFAEQRLGRGERWAWLVAVPALALVALWLFGYVTGASSGSGSLGSEGFGQFSADPLAFFNPGTWSRFFPPMPIAGRQYEGFAYLGLGVTALLVLRLARLCRQPVDWLALRSAWPLALVVSAMAVYALSNKVVCLQKPLADLSWFYERLGPLPAMFRSSGRFVWPLHAWVTLVAVLAAVRLPRPAWQRLSLVVAIALQLADFDPARTPMHQPPKRGFVPFQDPAWRLLGQGYLHVAIHPPQIQWSCPFDPVLVGRLSWEAARQRLSINSGHVGRPPPGLDCQRHLGPGDLRSDTVYLPYFAQYLQDFTSAGFACGPVEGVVLCVDGSVDTPLRAELLRRAGGG